MKTYLVGGAVRDELLGLPIKERDWVVVGASSEEMLSKGFVPVGKFFPVFLHPETKEEYALARMERKIAGGYHGFSFDTSTHVTLEEDLKRRDLTINAMAKSEDGKIIDPFGGQQDLKNKVLRHVSEAFVEDPVRVLRVARFAARFAPMGFTVHPDTLALMKKMAQNGELDFLIAERVWKEMARALAEESPISFVRLLRECGALKILLPEVDALYDHAAMVLEQATRLSADPKVRFAALVHNVGEELVLNICQRLRVPSDYQGLALIVCKYYIQCHKAKELSPEEILELLERCDAFRKPDRFELFLLTCEADSKGRLGFENEPYPSRDLLKSALNVAKKATPIMKGAGLTIEAALEKIGRSGEEIKKAFRDERVRAIIKLLKERSS